MPAQLRSFIVEDAHRTKACSTHNGRALFAAMRTEMRGKKIGIVSERLKGMLPYRQSLSRYGTV